MILKAIYLTPYDQVSFTRFWEVWDTELKRRLNYGPITQISDSPSSWKIDGEGRSALLSDYYKTLRTFYARIDSIIDDIRYENVAISPSASVLVATMDENDPNEATFFNTANLDDKYHRLSVRSKDFVIDDQTGLVPLGKPEPPRTFYTTSEYWTGANPSDGLIVDFGDTYQIKKLKILFPWWGGPQRANNRTYDYSVFYMNELPVASGGLLYQNREIAAPTTLFDYTALYGDFNRLVTTPNRPINLYIGPSLSGTGTDLNTFYVSWVNDNLPMRYLKVQIHDTHAWYGNDNDATAAYDSWSFQCDPSYRPGDDPNFGSKLGLMTYMKDGTLTEKVIADTAIKPANDCHASIVELGAFSEIIESKNIKPLALQRIDNNNRQITYYRVPDSTEMKEYTRDSIKFRKFEPGTFFRSATITWTGSNTTYHKFFKKDCTNCYPDGFNFGVIDDDSSLIYSSDDTFGTDISISSRQYTRFLITKGSTDSAVTSVDAWKGKTDPLSWGGSYSYTEKTNDYFIVHFRGESLKWYATIPDSVTGATVKIELRYKTPGSRKGSSNITTNFWSSWTTLEAGLVLPNGIINEVVYEIPYNSAILQPETVYELKVTLLDNNYCSVDSIEGYWSGSFTEYNEDSSRITLSRPSEFKQIQDGKFTGGTMYKWNKPGASAAFQFEGDRIIIQSAKGRNHGKLTLMLFQYEEGIVEYDPGVENHVFIPVSKGGDPSDGSYTINLNSGKRGQEIPGFVIFDSNDIFNDEGGLPWGKYKITITYTPAEKYTTTKTDNTMDSFQYRCRDCTDATGETMEIYKYVYLDAIGAHERVGVSVDFTNQTHLDILKSLTEVIQVEWDATESGLIVEPRIGRDTDIYLREGENTLVNYAITNDIKKIATTLLTIGSSIDGLDQFTITEDRKTKRLFNRTIMRQHDFRDIASYQQLIGLSRMELRKRNRPEKRITVTHVARSLDLEHGDSFILWTKNSGSIRLRIQRKIISENSSGRTYELECVEWPQIN